MAILSKIRERSLFLIVIIGLALFAFVLDPSKLADFFSSSKVNEVGEVNGEEISRQEFASAIEAYKTQTGNRSTEMQAAKIVWNNIVRKKIYQKQLSDAGITVGEADVWAELINTPTVQNNPQFKNEVGLFDEGKFKQFLVDIKNSDDNSLWNAWSNYMNGIRNNSERNTYNNLIAAGLGASLKEGEAQYLNDNVKVSAKYLYVPYTSIPDSLVSVSKDEIKAYMSANSDKYSVDASRDISYVKFDIKPTLEDEIALKEEVGELINDSEKINFVGFKNTKSISEFFNENGSDINLNENIQYKNQVSKEIADAVFLGNVGDVFGPYKDKGFMKLAKITAIRQMPDSVKASHILIAFKGSRSATDQTIQTEEQAKITADSIVKIVKRNRSKFKSLAKDFSIDKSNADKGGDLNWFTYNRMVPEFRDYCFSHKKGDIGIVKTAFGFHIIKIDDAKNIQKVVALAEFGRKIVPSEATESSVFQATELFVQEVTKTNKFVDIAKEKKYTIKPVVGLKVLDDNVPGIGNQRQIVTWAFNKDTNLGEIKRFDLEKGYIVARLTAKIKKGLSPVSRASSKIKPILINQKKTSLIQAKLKGTTLAEIAKANNVSVRTANGISFKSPTISGVGSEPKIVGAMMYAKENKLYNKGVAGTKGVFVYLVTKKELPTALPNYNFVRAKIAKDIKRRTNKVYDAIKNSSEIEDYRDSYYGIR